MTAQLMTETLASGGIRYSRVWEDHAVLEAGLDLAPDDDVISVTSAGDNVLALALQTPRNIVAVDLNPAQNALLELHIAAIRNLRHDEYVQLLGVVASGDRLATYDRVRTALPGYARDFWDATSGMLEVGIVNLGRLDLYFKHFQDEHLSRIHPRQRTEQLFGFDRLLDQRRFFLDVYATDELRELVVWYFGREMMEKRGRSAEQMAFVDVDDVGRHFWDQFVGACTSRLLRDDFYARLVLLSDYGDLRRGPPHLRPQNFDSLRACVESLRVETADVASVIEGEPRGTFSKANFSDLFEYLPEGATEDVFGLVGERFRPRSRVAWWELMVPRPRPASLGDVFDSLDALAGSLHGQDRVWFYRAFHVEELAAADNVLPTSADEDPT